MNPFNLSPAGMAFWGSIIRHVLTGIAGVLVTHGYVTKSGADAYEEELIGAIIYGAAAVWSNRVAYWQQIRQLVAGAMPGPVPATVVDAKVSELKEANALPSVFTPATVAPSLVKPIVLLLCVLGGTAALSMPACASLKMPATITTPAGQSAYRADQVIDRLNEVSDLVIGDTGDFSGGIKPADAFTIIEWISGDAHAHPPTTGIAQLVANTAGQGWKATAKQGWTARIRTIALKYPSIASYVPIIDALLEVL